MSTWHETGNPYAKVLQVEHSLPRQTVMSPIGAGRGVVEVQDGLPQPHPCVVEICKLDIVWQVVVEEGYLIVYVSQPHYWNTVLGEIQHIVARHHE